MNRTNKLWLPGMAGLAFVILNTAALVLDFVIQGTTGEDPFIGLTNMGAELLQVQGSSVWLVGAILRVVQIVPIALFVPGLYWIFRSEDDGGDAVHGLVGVFLFWMCSAFQNVATLAVVWLLAPAYSAGSQTAEAIEAAAIGLMAFGDVFFRPGGGLATLFLIVGLALLGRLTLRTDRLPRWTGYAALGAAAFSLLGLVQYVVPAFFAAGVPALALAVLWTLGVSLAFLRTETVPATAAPAGQTA